MHLTRRGFLQRSPVLLAPLALTGGWRLANSIAAASTGPAVATFNVRKFGARGNARHKDTRALQSAIDAAGKSGGRVYFPPGDYLSGTLRLRSHVVVQLEAGATLIASPDDADFDPLERLSYHSFADSETTDFNFALLRGRDLEQVTLLGPGRIDGNRSKRGGPKPIALKLCHQIRIRDLTILNSPNYNISLLGCDHVDIFGVTIRNGYCDGIDPDCCRDVRIANCDVESWDDAIVPKASYALGYRRSTENVTVTNCVLTTACNALKLGTESSGDFRNIAFSNCAVFARSDLWGRAPTSGVSLEMVDGGHLERVAVSNLTVADVRVPIFIRLGNRGRSQPAPTAGKLADVVLANIVATHAALTSSITGIPGHPVRGVTLRGLRLTARGGAGADVARREVPEMENAYPDGDQFGELPAYGLYCRHVAELMLDDVDLGLAAADARPAVVLDEVRGADLRTVIAAPPSGDAPVFDLRSARDCLLRGLRARPGTRRFLRLGGAQTERVHLTGSDLSAAEMPFVVAAEVGANAWRQEGNLLPR
ncbi:MAG: right-handed parallel beta-helix repeat-containing protein [Verrucomicrobia bacterium]|nr:right-handed parallel beta-helix repeat-containing protein [Verrucomicrobiota bacterium]